MLAIIKAVISLTEAQKRLNRSLFDELFTGTGDIREKEHWVRGLVTGGGMRCAAVALADTYPALLVAYIE